MERSVGCRGRRSSLVITVSCGLGLIFRHFCTKSGSVFILRTLWYTACLKTPTVHLHIFLLLCRRHTWDSVFPADVALCDPYKCPLSQLIDLFWELPSTLQLYVAFCLSSISHMEHIKYDTYKEKKEAAATTAESCLTPLKWCHSSEFTAETSALSFLII